MHLQSPAPSRRVRHVGLNVFLFPALTFSLCTGTSASVTEINLTPSGESTVAGFVETFAPVQPLFTNASPAERYIVAVGWVTRGEQERAGRRLLGVLYGAGAMPSLDQNRIFARWLQPRLVVRTADGRNIVGTAARGPARQLIPLDPGVSRADVQLLDESGTRLLGETKGVPLESGRVYRLEH